ncbi:MAG: RNA-directed DNA polymerase [Bacteroidales bacterium]|nr:RNA-directed DNA polymerase [Bacteroidales bacterium]
MSFTVPITVPLPETLPQLHEEMARIAVSTSGWAVHNPGGREFLSKAESRSFRQRFYREFSIPKKSGGRRRITAPTGYLKGAQKAIAVLLERLYEAPDMVNGFTGDRSVLTNAEAHVGRNYVFNTDLRDFFPSITAGMVRKTLEKEGVSPEVARYISVVCTITTGDGDLSEDVLPQGSPASPILSNMVCLQMDRHLDWLARRYGLTYTRYADDITFSSMHSVYGKNSPFLKGLKEIIEEYGFSINEEKTRLQKKGSRQEVTGLIVSDRVNVCRRYLKNLRAEVFRMEMQGFTIEEYRRVMGKIAFVGMVRGREDPLYRKLHNRIRSIKRHPEGFLAQPR